KNTELIWNSSIDVYQKIIDHPFLDELKSGTLDIEKFKFYLAQDSLYLSYYVRALSYLAAKSPVIKATNMFSRHVAEASRIEASLHSSILQKFGVNLSSYKQSPASRAYTDFLIAMTASEPFHVGLASVLPCYWIYREVGRHVRKTMSDDNPYVVWADVYSGKQYGDSVQEVLDLIDSMKFTEDQLGQMKLVFRLGSYYEYRFWDSAYKLEGWLIDPYF
ncbi:MAG: thiaminase II, partial [Conexivisphaerales archaeon]